MLKRELHIFFNALLFFTRIPCPKWVNTGKVYSEKSITYFSLIGILVGGLGASVFYGATFIFPKSIAVVLSMLSTIYLTGGFHEDGFADVCDGFGGGWTKEKILAIMKDSQIGVYGAIGLIFILGFKFLALSELPTAWLPLIIISGHSVSRLMAALLVYAHPYVSTSSTSKSESRASSMTVSMLLMNLMFGVLPLFFFQNYYIFFVVLVCYLGKLYLGNKFKKWIGGQTGDCAGAVQQFCEVIFYLGVLGVWKYI